MRLLVGWVPASHVGALCRTSSVPSAGVKPDVLLARIRRADNTNVSFDDLVRLVQALDFRGVGGRCPRQSWLYPRRRRHGRSVTLPGQMTMSSSQCRNGPWRTAHPGVARAGWVLHPESILRSSRMDWNSPLPICAVSEHLARRPGARLRRLLRSRGVLGMGLSDQVGDQVSGDAGIPGVVRGDWWWR